MSTLLSLASRLGRVDEVIRPPCGTESWREVIGLILGLVLIDQVAG